MPIVILTIPRLFRLRIEGLRKGPEKQARGFVLTDRILDLAPPKNLKRKAGCVAAIQLRKGSKS